MSATEPQTAALVRAHRPSLSDEPPFDASARKLTPEEIQWYAERRIYLDENSDVDEPPEGAMAIGIGPFHPNADVIRREKAVAAAKKKAGRTYSDGSYRISKRSPEIARTELIVTNALRYAEDLKKKEQFSQKAPTMPPSKRGRRVHFRC